MRKFILFPYHPDINILVEHRQSLEDWDICGVASFKEDCHLTRSLNQKLGVEDLPFDQLLRNCDAVILLDNYRNLQPGKYYQIIEEAIYLRKEIFVTPQARTQLDLDKYKGRYQLLEHLPDDIAAIDKEYMLRQGATDNKLYSIEVPIIGVYGQGKHCDKFENQLLTKQVLEKEYKTTVVSSNALGILFGCYSMPSFLFDKIPFQEKIFKFNYYIRIISKTCTPDAMIIGIPEGVTPFRRQEFHHFAEYPLVISSAVDFDLAILCTYFLSGDKLDSGLKAFVDFFQNKFGIPVGAVSISRAAVDVPSEEDKGVNWEHLGQSYLRKYYPDLKSINLPMIDLLNREDAMVTIAKSLGRLQENVGAI